MFCFIYGLKITSRAAKYIEQRCQTIKSIVTSNQSYTTPFLENSKDYIYINSGWIWMVEVMLEIIQDVFYYFWAQNQPLKLLIVWKENNIIALSPCTLNDTIIMYDYTEEVQGNVTIDHQVKHGEIVGKKWPNFDYDPGKNEHYEIYVSRKNHQMVPFLLVWFFLNGTRIRLLWISVE